MSRYETTDLFFTEDGDFALNERGEFLLSSGNELIHQNIVNTMKSSNPDWFMENFPADLEDLIGLENSRETGELGKSKIINGLMRTGFFNRDDIWVEARPSGSEGILFVVFINSPFADEPMVYRVDLDLGFGTSIRRIQ